MMVGIDACDDGEDYGVAFRDHDNAEVERTFAVGAVPRGRAVVFVVDDMRLRREAIAYLIRAWSHSTGGSLIASNGDDTGAEALDAQSAVIALFILGGSRMEEPDSRRRMKEMAERMPGIPFAVMSDREEGEEMRAAFRAGARGFIPTSIDPALAMQALAFMVAGGTFFPPAVLLESPATIPVSATEDRPAHEDPAAAKPSNLTARQLEVLNLLRQGLSNKLIARRLRMCESTVKVHVRQILRKTGSLNRTQAALVSPDEGADG